MEIPLKQVSDILDNAVSNLDRTRAADLTELSQARSAKFAGLARDRARLAAKLGDTSPRVLALDRAIALHKDTLNGYAAESASSSVTPPRVDARSWILHGNVVDSSRAPVAGVTVALYDKTGWVERLGYACTDAHGYFALPAAQVVKTETPLSVYVLSKGKPIYVDPAPVTVQPGSVEYREITIGGDSGGRSAGVSCDPPSGTRKDAPSSDTPRQAAPPEDPDKTAPAKTADSKPGPSPADPTKKGQSKQ